MWALYSLACRVRMLYALLHGIVTLVQGGWTVLAPAQFLVPGLMLCLVVRGLVPSASAGGHKPMVCANRLLDGLAAASAVGLSVADAADLCVSSLGLVALVLCR